MIDHREHRGHRAQNQFALKLAALAQSRMSFQNFFPSVFSVSFVVK